MMRSQKQWPYLYFTFSRAKTENLSYALKHWLHNSLLSEEELDKMQVIVDQFLQMPGGQEALQENVLELLQYGVAFHHAGVHVLIKHLVETLYEQRLIKALVLYGNLCTWDQYAG